MTDTLRPARPIHPGVILRREMKAQGKSQRWLWSHSMLSIRQIRGLVREQYPVTEHVAYQLARALGTSPEFWLKLQRQYDEAVAASEEKPQ